MRESFSEAELRAAARNLGMDSMLRKPKRLEQVSPPLKEPTSIYCSSSFEDRRLIKGAMTHGVSFGPDDLPPNTTKG